MKIKLLREFFTLEEIGNFVGYSKQRIYSRNEMRGDKEIKALEKAVKYKMKRLEAVRDKLLGVNK